MVCKGTGGGNGDIGEWVLASTLEVLKLSFRDCASLKGFGGPKVTNMQIKENSCPLSLAVLWIDIDFLGVAFIKAAECPHIYVLLLEQSKGRSDAVVAKVEDMKMKLDSSVRSKRRKATSMRDFGTNTRPISYNIPHTIAAYTLLDSLPFTLPAEPRAKGMPVLACST